MNQHTQMTQTRVTDGLSIILFILFTFLKLTGLVTWSWWWVTSPLWLPLVFILSLVILGVIALIIITFIEKFKEKIWS